MCVVLGSLTHPWPRLRKNQCINARSPCCHWSWIEGCKCTCSSIYAFIQLCRLNSAIITPGCGSQLTTCSFNAWQTGHWYSHTCIKVCRPSCSLQCDYCQYRQGWFQLLLSILGTVVFLFPCSAWLLDTGKSVIQSTPCV